MAPLTTLTTLTLSLTTTLTHASPPQHPPSGRATAPKLWEPVPSPGEGIYMYVSLNSTEDTPTPAISKIFSCFMTTPLKHFALRPNVPGIAGERSDLLLLFSSLGLYPP